MAIGVDEELYGVLVGDGWHAFFGTVLSALGVRVAAGCDDDDIGSIRTIEKNGGILDNVVCGPDLDEPKRRYSIETRATVG